MDDATKGELSEDRMSRLGLAWKKINQMLMEEFGTVDEDPPVQVILIERATHEYMHYHPIPYCRKPVTLESACKTMRVAETNLRIAHDRFSLAFRVYELVKNKKEAKNG